MSRSLQVSFRPGVTRSLEQSEAAGVDWRELLRRAWSETIPSDYSWMPPNRRHIWAGLYLPGIRSEGAGEIAIAVDCSGSINARQLGSLRGGNSLYSRRTTPKPSARAVLRYGGP